jgi:2-oxo-hept-3-ene-1,7-dioate hydratase
MNLRHSFAALVAACLPIVGWAACPDDATVAAYVEEFRAGKPSQGFGKEITAEDARCARAKLIQALPSVLGERVGYKSVFTTEESQKRFGVSGPSWGAMYAGMMLLNSTLVPTRFWARPRHEADFIVIVKDAGLADAESVMEALDHITYVVPFIELADIMLDKPNGLELTATNAAFRGGVLGPRIPVQRSRAFLKMLEEIEVVVAEERTGKELGRARGSALMGQPIRAALWLAKALRKEGIELQPGELLSLGGFLPSMPVEAGTSISVSYLGLPDNPIVMVHFE